MDTLQTTATFQNLKEGADRYIKRRNLRLLANHRKELRNFTRAEASTYLDIDAKTLDKYVATAEIDPRRHEESQWSIDMAEMYRVRDLLPDALRKEPKFARSEKQSMQVVVIQNQKGGVGKTVSAATLASGLATEFHQEYRVGLIDMDGQATLSMYYAPESEMEGCLSIGDLMMRNFELDEGETYEQAVSEAFLETTIPNLRILPASQTDRAIEGWFHEQVFSQKLASPYSLLRDIIAAVEDEFDILIIDTPPSLGYATYNAYFAATSVVFPLSITENDIDATCSYFSYIPQVWALLANADHQGYDFMKILLTNHRDSSTTTELMNSLYDHFASYLYSKEFKHSEAIRQSSSLLSTVFDMSKSEYPKSKATFQSAQQNAYEVTSQILRDIINVWREQEQA
ncbi:chromosome partitioning protein ParA [Vibrio coralliilyticus]|jgi:cellulose biosynthesis protein BcsQ|uniref:Chromosome partitioning protein ParA n=1 Tax=Vibrio coralliilyticus TaxID=190893 RepID=A0A837G884_9VIBR|nr:MULTISPECIES: ParA family protein [Vibrio]EEX34577.1 chromosome (plasmid) partitioning protein ParA [Vibrio coralliilyticus ATCC BAA-450]ERB63356.1 chromosome partitioning protein ParA [Vibrio coralliilyticus OCN008]KJY67746.1 chromosome partitioning protein ParA [Vibrio coralliilyticus]MDE3898622.1 AAA family ATPase [Vibrio sp. CC007]NRF16267.1 AAA family ATPase [Vibrio coralliilyticus]